MSRLSLSLFLYAAIEGNLHDIHNSALEYDETVAILSRNSIRMESYVNKTNNEEPNVYIRTLASTCPTSELVAAVAL